MFIAMRVKVIYQTNTRQILIQMDNQHLLEMRVNKN